MAARRNRTSPSGDLGVSTAGRSNNVTLRSPSHQERCQTIPKAVDAIEGRSRSSGGPSQDAGLQDITALGGSGNYGMQQVVDSLMTPTRFTDYITVEPLAFLAVLSLYIEFPSIQDLIYTKICLQVVAEHQLGSTTGFNGSNTIGPQSLPDSGRIQSWSNPPAAPISNVTPVSPTTNYHSICDRLNKTAIPDSVRQEIKSIDAKFWLTYQIVVCSISFLVTPFWGGISDRLGRIIPMNAPILANILNNLISLLFGLLISFHSNALLGLEWLFLGASLVGISGGQGIVIANAVSYISDDTPNETRSKRITVLESTVFVAQSVGFLLSKFLMRLGLAPPDHIWHNRHCVAFSICVLLNMACILYSVLRLRHRKFHRFMNNFEREQQESTMVGGDSMCSLSQTSAWDKSVRITGQCNDRLPELSSSTLNDIRASDGQNSDNVCRSIFTFTHYRDTFRSAMKPREARSIILLILLAAFMSALSLATLLSFLYIYLRSEPFNWSTSEYSKWNSINSVSRSFALIGLTLCMKLVRNWNVPDPLVALVGFLSKGLGLLMIGLAESGTIIYWSILAFVFSEYSLPPLRSLMSKLVLQDERAKLFSCLSALQNLCFLLGNIAFYMTYTSVRIEGYFRIAFITVAALEFTTVIVMLVIYINLRQRVLIV